MFLGILMMSLSAMASPDFSGTHEAKNGLKAAISAHAEMIKMVEVVCPFSKLTDSLGNSLPTSGLKFVINFATKEVVTSCTSKDEDICILDGETETLKFQTYDGRSLNIQGNNGDSTDLFIRLALNLQSNKANGFMSTGSDEPLSDVSDMVSCAVRAVNKAQKVGNSI